MPKPSGLQSWKSEPILIWGIAGASLGAEITKCLSLAGCKRLIGCDISPLAYGHFSGLYSSTHVIDARDCRESLARLLKETRPRLVIAGGDQVSRIISQFADVFASNDCTICGNSPATVELASDKYRVMLELKDAGFKVPRTHLLEDSHSLEAMRLPVVLKPRFDSGGSRGVSVVTDERDLPSRLSSILQSGTAYIAQDYVPEQAGEYTIGVLSDSAGQVAGSILMRRTFQNMLSVHERSEGFLISSGSSQGLFEHHPKWQMTAEAVAQSLGSVGPLNIQARIIDGELAPFEVNPRFSASTYLRALSGVNEVALYIEHLATGNEIVYPPWKEGVALRAFSEVFVEREKVSKNVF